MVQHHADVPPICNMLVREAEAWRAVLGLHTAAISAAQQIARCPDNSSSALIEYDQAKLNSESREAAYCSALSALASQCDTLYSEVVKLRALRKARYSVEIECVKEITRAHSDEILALGQSLASEGSLNVASTTAELRSAIQGQRNQVSQLRMFLESIKEASALPLPKGGKLVVGVLSESGEHDLTTLDDILKMVYEASRDVTDESLASVLSTLFIGSPHSCNKEVRQFARRSEGRR